MADLFLKNIDKLELEGERMKKQLKVFFWALKCSFIISPLRFIFNLFLVIVSSVLPVALATYSGSVSEHIIELAGMGGEYKFIFKEIAILGLIFVMNKFLFYGSGIITSALDIRINAKIKETYKCCRECIIKGI